jgi:hypothetical protein
MKWLFAGITFAGGLLLAYHGLTGDGDIMQSFFGGWLIRGAIAQAANAADDEATRP